MQPISVIVFEHRSHALLEIRGSNDLAIFRSGQTHPAHLTARWLNDEIGHVQPIRSKPIGRQHQLAAPGVAELRNDFSNRFVAAAITSSTQQDWTDVFRDAGNSELPRDHRRYAQALRITLALRHKKPEHVLWPDSFDRERGTYRAIHSATHPND